MYPNQSCARQEADQARDAEAEQWRIAGAVNDFLNVDLLAAVAPSAEAGRGKDVLKRDVLDQAAERTEEASFGQLGTVLSTWPRIGGRWSWSDCTHHWP